MFECHPELCRAGDRCLNQRFQKRLYPQLQVVRTGSKGWGLATSVDLKKGQFLTATARNAALIDNFGRSFFTTGNDVFLH